MAQKSANVVRDLTVRLNACAIDGALNVVIAHDLTSRRAMRHRARRVSSSKESAAIIGGGVDIPLRIDFFRGFPAVRLMVACQTTRVDHLFSAAQSALFGADAAHQL